MAKFEVGDVGWLVGWNNFEEWIVSCQEIMEREIHIVQGKRKEEFTDIVYKLDDSNGFIGEEALQRVFFNTKDEALKFIESQKIKIIGED